MLPDKPWSRDAVIRLFLGLLMSLSFGVLLSATVVHLSGDRLSESNKKFVTLIITSLAFHGAGLGWIFVFLRESGLGWRETFGFDAPKQRAAAGWGVVLGVAFLPGAWSLQQLSSLLMTLLHQTPQLQQVVLEMKAAESPAHRIYFCLLAVGVAPLIEELLFRGVLYPTIKRAGYPRLALWGASLIFAATHYNIPTLLPLTVFSILLIALYERTGSLLAPIVAHASFNGANYLLIYLNTPLQRLLPAT